MKLATIALSELEDIKYTTIYVYCYDERGNFCGTREDRLYGQSGNDSLCGNGDNILLCGNGDNILPYGQGDNDSLYYDFEINSGTAKDGFATVDTLKNLENIIGSEFDDVLVGNNQNNSIQGLGGNDLLIGNDQFEGGSEIDIVVVFQYSDQITGDSNANIITDDDGNNTIKRLGSNDQLYGDTGSDIIDDADYTIYTSDGDNQLLGQAGEDTLYTGAGNDRLWSDLVVFNDNYHLEVNGLLVRYYLDGDEDNDYIEGGTGDDYIDGGSENDTIYAGDDEVYGQTGENFLDGGAGNDYLEGAEGYDNLYSFLVHITNSGSLYCDPLIININNLDTLSFRRDPGSVRVNLTTSRVIDGWGGNDIISAIAGNDSISTIENVAGSQYIDEIIGDRQNNIITGDAGDGIIEGREGDDKLYGELGDDEIWGGNGRDIIYGKADNDRIYGDAGDDTIYAGDGYDWVVGGAGNDFLDDGEGQDYLNAGDGYDWVVGGAGNDFLDDGEGQDYLNAGDGDDQLLGQAGYDTLCQQIKQEVYSNSIAPIILDLNGDGIYTLSFRIFPGFRSLDLSQNQSQQIQKDDDSVVLNMGGSLIQVEKSDGYSFDFKTVFEKSLEDSGHSITPFINVLLTTQQEYQIQAKDLSFDAAVIVFKDGCSTIDIVNNVGRDTIYSNEGKDIFIYAGDSGDSNDYLYGGTGDDQLLKTNDVQIKSLFESVLKLIWCEPRIRKRNGSIIKLT